nr:4'-phosphopantetheinyl transferase [uncultured bacterium]ASV47024.1 4'-phosphopantetheinyl transferase [uncultured bacterium]
MRNEAMTIGREQAHLWACEPDELARTGHLSRYVGILSPAERDRMQRFVFERDRLAYLAAHGLARMALSSCVPSVSPEVWEFNATERGKPEIAAPLVRPVLRFNISHTCGLVACLVVAEADCGVDVEMFDRPTDVTRLAKNVLSPGEYWRLSTFPAPERAKIFFRYWTLKEAYVKARGGGISLPLDKCTFEFHREGIRVWFDSLLDDNAASWQFAQWSPTEKHLLAVALRGGPRADYRIVSHRGPPDRT